MIVWQQATVNQFISKNVAAEFGCYFKALYFRLLQNA